MRVYVREDEVTQDSSLVDQLYPKRLRAIAITELMLQEPPWVEPPEVDAYDLSTLAHQVLSVLAETGGCQAVEVFQQLCTRGAFRNISSRMFADLLRCLGEKNMIEQMEGGDLILAPKGEAVVSHYSFYSAFAGSIDYRVHSGSVNIGTLPALYLPHPGDCFLLGGRRWQVVSVDHDGKVITVCPARGKKPPKFTGGGGDVHPKVRQMMRKALLDARTYPYLNNSGARLLQKARIAARQARLHQQSLIPLSPARCLWFTWTGTKAQRTLSLISDMVGLLVIDRDVAIEFGVSPDEVLERLSEAGETSVDPFALAERMPCKRTRKLDEFIAEPLLIESLAHDAIDLPAAQDLLRSLFVLK